MHSSQWVGGDAPVHFDRAVNEIAKSVKAVGNWSKTSGSPECCDETAEHSATPGSTAVCTREGQQGCQCLRSSITQAPDALVKELMDVHGWPAHEALCAVQQLQQDVLDDTTEQASA